MPKPVRRVVWEAGVSGEAERTGARMGAIAEGFAGEAQRAEVQRASWAAISEACFSVM